jgi:hypothetical protein
MPIKIIEFTEQYEAEVNKFNERLSCNEITFSFPSIAKTNHSGDGDLHEKKYPTENFYLAIDEAGKVRGGYVFQEHPFVVNGVNQILGFMKLPLSEGIINKAYNMVGIMLVKHALNMNPYVYALGMGGIQGPFAKLLKAMGWQITIIPFYFSIINPVNFLKNINSLRTTRSRSKILDLIALSGLGWLVHSLSEFILSLKSIHIKKADYVMIQRFGDWVDEIWNSMSSVYPFISMRDAATLNNIYKSDSSRFQHMQITQSGTVIGWSTLLDMAKTDSPYFGNMRVICIINCHCIVGNEAALVHALKKRCRSSGHDLVVGNFSNHNYMQALKSCGFLPGPSNMAMAMSPELSKLCKDSGIEPYMMHITRGDGDGE